MNIPEMRKFWVMAGAPGLFLWLVALALWGQGTLDQWVLFYFDPARVARSPGVVVAEWVTGYGMSVITALYVLYLLGSLRFPAWDAPKFIYLYVIFSFGLSGIVGDLMKMVLGRPRPVSAFTDQVFVLSDATTHAIPSGHATKAFALAVPFLFLVASKTLPNKLLKCMLLFLALGVGFSRIVLGAHYVSDVVAGIGMALIGLPFAMLLAHKILIRIDEDQLPGVAKKWGIVLAVLTVVLLLI